MKLTSSDLATCAETIGQKKFIKLSPKRQHELLASMALKARESQDYHGFYQRYDLLQSWADLDKYHPPSWLSDKEALHEFWSFHDSFSPHPIDHGQEKRLNDSLSYKAWQPKFDVTVALDQIRSPYNVGSILRIIDNFGFKGLVHSTSGLSLSHPQLRKAARGCEKWIPVRFEADLIAWLKNSDEPVIGIEKTPDALTVNKWEPPHKCILIVGNEEYGIADSVRKCCSKMVQIPMFGYKNSMNVHNALSIIAQKISEEFW